MDIVFRNIFDFTNECVHLGNQRKCIGKNEKKDVFE